MIRVAALQWLRSPFFRGLGTFILYALAAIGLLWLIGGSLARFATGWMFETTIVRSVSSPDQRSIAEVEVRKGGLGTVWTTRVRLRPEPSSKDYWTVYKAKDSDFVPPLRWADRDTLVIGLPCGRFDYASNPDDWERTEPNERRIKVRFSYAEDCPVPLG